MKKVAILMACSLYVLLFFPLSLKAQTNPELTFHENQTIVGVGDRFTLELEISGTSQEPLDLYIAVRLPDENFLFFTQNPFTPFVPEPRPYRQNFDVSNDLLRILHITATEELEGEYVFIAAFIRAGRSADIFNVVGNIEQVQIRIVTESVPEGPIVEEMAVSPDEVTLTSIDEQQQLIATGIYSDGSREDVTTAVHWESSDDQVATVDAAGMVTAISSGTAIITAGYNGLSATSQITISVAPRLISISITAENAILTAEGQTSLLRATGTYSDGSTRNITNLVSWVSANPRIAEVSNSGLVKARNNGSTVITAALEGISGTIAVWVNISPALRTITIRAVGPAAERDGAYVLTSAAETLQLMAQGTYTDGSTRDITGNVTWSSSNPSVATISPSGLVTALSNGSITINVRSGALLAAFRSIIVDISDFSGRYFFRSYPFDLRVVRNTTSLSDYEIWSRLRLEFSFQSESWYEGNIIFEQEGTNLRLIFESTGAVALGIISGNRFILSQGASTLIEDCLVVRTITDTGTISNGFINGEERRLLEFFGSRCRERGMLFEFAIPFDGQRL